MHAGSRRDDRDPTPAELLRLGPQKQSTLPLAGHNRQDPSGIDDLLDASLEESGLRAITDSRKIVRTAVEWSRTTGSSMATAMMPSDPSPSLEKPIGICSDVLYLDEEWEADWGRNYVDLEAEAREMIDDLLRGGPLW